MRRKVLARSVRSVIEKLEGRRLLSATFAANAGSASVSGTVYDDVNGNGVRDAGEPVIVGTTITLSQVGAVYAPGTVPTVQTDLNGAFSFTTLAPGQYTVGSIPSPGFVQDAPGTFSVSLTNNDAISIAVGETGNGNGGGAGLGTITATVFNDVNQDGVYTPVIDDFLAGDTVYLDLNGSGVQTPNDPVAVTNNTGQYTFNNVAPGSYILRVVPRPGFHQDPPGYAQFNVYSGQTVGQNLGENDRATISGVVFQDINSNAVQDAGELGVAGETVFLDQNFDGLLQAGVYNLSTGHWDANPVTGGTEPWTTTDATGHYSFTGLTQGTYRVIVGSLVGLLPRAPGYTDVNLNTGQDLVLNLPEGAPATIGGTIYDDLNANGTMDVGEPALADQTAFLDLNNNGVYDVAGNGADGLPLGKPEPFATSNASGQFIFAGVEPGTYTLRLMTPGGGIPTGPANASHSYTFTVAAGQILTGQDLGFQTPDLTAEIVSFPTAPTLTHVRKTARVRISNVGSLPVNGLAGIDLWAQTTNGPVDVKTAFLVGSMQGRAVHLAVGQSKTFTFRFAYPTQLPLNSYFVSAQVVSTVHDNNLANDFSMPVGPVNVGPPYIDLGVAYAGEPQLIVDPGTATAVDLVVTNTGNVASRGTASFRFYMSQGPVVEPTDVVVHTETINNLRIAPGKSKLVHLTLPFPGQALGFKYINIGLDSGDSLGEQNLLNNIAIEPSPTRFD